MGGGDHRGRGARRCAAARVSASRQIGRHGQGAEGAARRAVHGLEGGCRLAGVVGGWREPRAGGRAGEDGGRAGNVGLGAKEAQRRGASDQHADRDVGGLRRPVVVAASGDDPGARAGASEGRPLLANAGRGAVGVLGRVRDLLSHRGIDVPGDLHAAVVQVRGLAVARRGAPGPRRRGARADHRRGDRDPRPSDRSAGQAHDRSLDPRADSSSGWSAWRCR